MHCETSAANTQIVQKCQNLGKPKNVSKNLTFEQDQVFGANMKIGLRKKGASVVLYHDTSYLKTSSGPAYGFELLIPKAEYFFEASLAN